MKTLKDYLLLKDIEENSYDQRKQQAIKEKLKLKNPKRLGNYLKRVLTEPSQKESFTPSPYSRLIKGGGIGLKTWAGITERNQIAQPNITMIPEGSVYTEGPFKGHTRDTVKGQYTPERPAPLIFYDETMGEFREAPVEFQPLWKQKESYLNTLRQNGYNNA